MLAKSPRITRETIIAMARSVGDGPLLQLANAQLEGLRKVYDEAGAEQSARIRQHQDIGGQADAIQRAQPALEEMRQRITARRAEIVKQRMARASRVAEHLSQVRKEAAERVIAALAELDEASEILITCCEEIRFAGDHDVPHLSLVPAHSMRDHASRILGATK
ncbi:hypothetical protein [Bradyrhizobium sp. LA7.1]|uniref:hypothetical protein n=1 Tax=Bradyrhizobium sp. LA7.1 TaxID=3156324 RepID=UPI003398EE5C